MMLEQELKVQSLIQAQKLHDVFKQHSDGLINLHNDSDAHAAVQMLSHNDSGLGGMLRTMLTYYSPKVIRTEYRDTPYANPLGFVSRTNDGTMVGVSEIVKTVIGRSGKWASTGEVSRNAGRIDVGMSDITYGSRYKTAAIGYSSQELDRVYFASQNTAQFGVMVDVVSEKMNAAAAAYQEFLNEVFSIGMPSQDVFGLHTHPNIVRIKAPYRPGALRTAEENLALFTLGISVMNSISANRYDPDIVIGPKAISNELTIQRVGASSDLSVLKYLAANSSIKGYVATAEADTASRTGGAILHFMRRDEDTQGIVTKTMTQLSTPTWNDGEWKINWDASVSGVHCDRPYKHVILELP